MVEALLHAGREALRNSDWPAARRHFEQALSLEPANIAALEGLAWSASWTGDEATLFSSREAAYRISLETADLVSAARSALWLAIDSLEFRGQGAVSNGWFQRARRHLQGFESRSEYALMLAIEGQMALMMRNDPDEALRSAAEAATCARRIGDRDLEGVALALQGLAFVTSGEIARGIAFMDEAGIAASSGEVSDHNAVAMIICCIVDGYGRVRDFDRSAQWIAQIEQFARRISVGDVAAVCRPHYAYQLMWRGAWREAEDQLQRGIRDLSRTRAPMAVEAIVRLGDLRVRQGRYDEARTLLEPVKSDGIALVPLAEMALATGDLASAVELAEKRLRQLPERDVIQRFYPVDLLVRAHYQAGDTGALGKAVAQLEKAAAKIGTPVVTAAALAAKGYLSAANGNHETAWGELERAADTYEAAGAVYELARIRLELAAVLLECGLTPRAAAETQLALDTFRQIGAAADAMRAESLLMRLGAGVIATGPSAPADNGPSLLTAREIEVLCGLAAGKSNTEIAAELVLSVRTVERHVTNIYSKLGLTGKTARAGATAYAFTNGYSGRRA